MPLKLDPLTPSERERFRTAATEGDPHERLTGLVLLDTGLRRDTFAHMRDYSGNKWYQPAESPPSIRVPAEDECKVGYGEKGVPETKGEALCYNCTQRGEPNWVPKTDTSVRRVWVHEDDTQKAIEDWFTLHDDVSSPERVSRAVKKITERADLDRKVSPHHLRQTYGSRLAEQSHNAYEIRDLMGHASIVVGEKYVRLFGPHLRDSHAEKWE